MKNILLTVVVTSLFWILVFALLDSDGTNVSALSTLDSESELNLATKSKEQEKLNMLVAEYRDRAVDAMDKLRKCQEEIKQQSEEIKELRKELLNRVK